MSLRRMRVHAQLESELRVIEETIAILRTSGKEGDQLAKMQAKIDQIKELLRLEPQRGSRARRR